MVRGCERHPAVTGAIAGAWSPGRVGGFIGAAEWRLTEEEFATIEGWLGG